MRAFRLVAKMIARAAAALQKKGIGGSRHDWLWFWHPGPPACSARTVIAIPTKFAHSASQPAVGTTGVAAGREGWGSKLMVGRLFFSFAQAFRRE